MRPFWFCNYSSISGDGGWGGHRFGAHSRPGLETCLGQFEDGLTVFGDDLPPGEAAEHREIDSAEADARDKDVDAVAERLVVERVDSVGDGLCAVSVGPAIVHFFVGFGDGHLERS